MKKHTFVVVAYAPDGVAASEIADHLADASRWRRREYHESDPLSALPDIQVFGTVAAAALPSAREVHACPRSSTYAQS